MPWVWTSSVTKEVKEEVVVEVVDSELELELDLEDLAVELEAQGRGLMRRKCNPL